jgi:hypothetical protein
MQGGIDPEQFWRLTPYLTRLSLQGLREGKTILAWQIAALSRQKKLPELDALLGKKKTGRDLKEALSGFKGRNG